MKRISKLAKQIADNHLSAAASKSFDDTPFESRDQLIQLMKEGKTFSGVLDQIEVRFMPIGTILINGLLRHQSKAYKAAVYKGFKTLIDEQGVITLFKHKNNKKMTIEVTRGQFCHDWTLSAHGRKFYLGQDVKFCSRVLGMSPATLIREAGCPYPCDMTIEANRKKIAKLICSHLGIDRKTAKQIEPWGLAAN